MMRVLPLFCSLVLLGFSLNIPAAPINPLLCSCDFEEVLPNGLGKVDATDCQITGETDQFRDRGARGAFAEILTFVGGENQACATMEVRKFKVGNDNRFSCTIWLERSTSGDQANCVQVIPRDAPAQHNVISRRGMRRCQRLLDDVADEVFALPDCGVP